MKIYDCFTFFNELDLLEIRLNELNEVVDYFVIVEANKTQTGKDKEYYFEKSKSRFKRFEEKIIHLKINMPPTKNFWVMENYQRDCILKGLKNCKDEDIILISDLDEIPNKNKIKNILELLHKPAGTFEKFKNKINEINFYILIKLNGRSLSLKNKIIRKLMKINDRLFPNSNIIICNQKQYYYYFNYFKNTVWTGTRILKYDYLINKMKCPQNTRYRFYGQNLNCGWHFSYLGNWKKLKIKSESFADSERIRKKLSDSDYKSIINEGKDIITGNSYNLKKVNIDSSYPDTILKNQKKYKKYIL